MTDQLELLVPDPSYDSDLSEEEVRDAVLRLAREAFPDSTIREGDAGLGASWPVFVLTIAGILFFSGKKIEENLDAWVSLAKRFRGLVSRIKEKFGAALVDQAGAELLVVAEVTVSMPRELVVLSSSVATIRRSDTIGAQGLEATPERLYVVVVQADEVVHVFGIDSRGQSRFHHCYRAFPPLEPVDDDDGHEG